MWTGWPCVIQPMCLLSKGKNKKTKKESIDITFWGTKLRIQHLCHLIHCIITSQTSVVSCDGPTLIYLFMNKWKSAIYWEGYSKCTKKEWESKRRKEGEEKKKDARFVDIHCNHATRKNKHTRSKTYTPKYIPPNQSLALAF